MNSNAARVTHYHADAQKSQRKRSLTSQPCFSTSEEKYDSLTGFVPTKRRIEASSHLFRCGDEGLGFFRLEKGKIQLQRTTPDGNIVIMHTVRHGEYFAESSLHSDQYHCDAVAACESEVSVYHKAEITKYMLLNPEALWAFTAEFANRIQDLRTRLELKHIRSAPQRLLQFLRQQCDESGTLRLDGTLIHLAKELGLTHESLYRALATMVDKGWIERERNEIRLLIK